MALIPGTLPNDTCYGTPQDLLELFAQYLDVPAFALNSKVVFGTSSAGLTADVIWFDTTAPTNPIMKITVSGGFVDYIKNYITSAATVTIVGADSVLILDASDSGNTKKGLVSDIVSLVPITPAAGSITYPMLSTSATEADNAAKRVAKAWVSFNGVGTPSIRADFNISTIGDNGTGDYTLNFSSNLASADYSVVGCCSPNWGVAYLDCSYATTGSGSGEVTPTTSSVRVATANHVSGGSQDSKFVSFQIFL
jgi:hypothetical protein